MKKVSIQKTRENLAEIIDQVAVGGDTFLVTKYNKPKVKIIPYKKKKIAKKKKQALEAAYGIWKEREDIENGLEYENKMRQERYEKILS